MSYVAYITTLKNVQPHPNADRLLLGDCFGNTICVSLDYKDGQIGVYFPMFTTWRCAEKICKLLNENKQLPALIDKLLID